MQRMTANLVDRLQALPPDQLVEVEEFVESLQSGARLSAVLSEPSFAAVWSNPEDDAYDKL